MTATYGIRDVVEEDLSLSAALRDEIGAKIHLADVELLCAWRQLEPNVIEAERAARERVTQTTRLLLAYAIERLRSMRGALGDVSITTERPGT